MRRRDAISDYGVPMPLLAQHFEANWRRGECRERQWLKEIINEYLADRVGQHLATIWPCRRQLSVSPFSSQILINSW